MQRWQDLPAAVRVAFRRHSIRRSSFRETKEPNHQKPERNPAPSPKDIPKRACPMRNKDLPKLGSQREDERAKDRILPDIRSTEWHGAPRKHPEQDTRQRRPRIPPRRRIQHSPQPRWQPRHLGHFRRRNPRKIEKRHHTTETHEKKNDALQKIRLPSAPLASSARNALPPEASRQPRKGR